jgi:hypothetical protein
MTSQRPLVAQHRGAHGAKAPHFFAGKRRVNADTVQNSFYSAKFTIPGESQDEFYAMYSEFLAEYRPVGPAETSLVQQLVLAHWRIIRTGARIAAAFESEDGGSIKDLASLERMLSSAERSFSRALQDLRKLQAELVDNADPIQDTIPVEEGQDPRPPHLIGLPFDIRRSTEWNEMLQSLTAPNPNEPQRRAGQLQPHHTILDDLGLNARYQPFENP